MKEKSTVKIRLMKADDLDAVVRIDEKALKIEDKALKASRREYYRLRFGKFVQSKDNLPVSLVAEKEDGTVVGFVMGELYIGEYGISHETATLDTIGVDPDYERMGIGGQLIKEYMAHMKALGVRKINTLIEWNDYRLIHFFSVNQFSPSQTINLVRTL